MLINTDKLIGLLEEAFPDKLPRAVDGIEDVRFLQGEQKVIDHIKSLVESLEEEALTDVHGRS